jgi:hypothetical protein
MKFVVLPRFVELAFAQPALYPKSPWLKCAIVAAAGFRPSARASFSAREENLVVPTGLEPVFPT